MKTTAVDTIYAEFRDAAAILAAAGEISLQITLDSHMRKTLLLSAASYFEAKLTKEVQEFTDEITSCNELIGSLVHTKAISRQYHTWFDWDRNNANKFFSLFGKSFKEHMERRLNECDVLAEGVKAFMEIGRERNLLAHSDYASHSINKTPDEVYELYKKAIFFIEIIGVEMRDCSSILTSSSNGLR